MSNDDTIDTLNDLIETSKDGEYGFRTSAEYLKGSEIKQLFLRRADECRQAAADLQALVVQCGGSAEDSGSAEIQPEFANDRRFNKLKLLQRVEGGAASARLNSDPHV